MKESLATPLESGRHLQKGIIPPEDVGVKRQRKVDKSIEHDNFSSGLSGIRFSPSLHGFKCDRGELWLSEQEAHNLSILLDKPGFKFLPVETALSPFNNVGGNFSKKNCLKPEALTGGIQRITNTVHSEAKIPFTSPSYISVNQKSEIASSLEEKRKKQTHNYAALSFTGKSGLNDRIITSENLLSVPFYSPSAMPISGNPVSLRVSKRKKGLLEGNWWDLCSEVTSRLEQEPAAKFFLTPSDNYSLSKEVSGIDWCPMDFQTVNEKLQHGMYSHPFRWQEDVRAIFYNAFIYEETNNLVWNNAFYLANLFESLCKQYEGVNPYAQYVTKKSSTVKVESSAITTSRKCHKTKSNEKNKDKKNKTIVLETSKLLELLEKAAKGATPLAYANDDKILDPGINGISKGQIKGKIKQNVETKVYTLGPPSLPNPPIAPPLISRVKLGDKVPNVIHKKLMDSQFKQLDVHLRKAAIELVKDELGVDSALACCDPNFKIDFEVLPFLKQRQLLSYLRTLDTFQRKKIEEGYRVTLADQLVVSTPDTLKERVEGKFSTSEKVVKRSISDHPEQILIERTPSGSKTVKPLDKLEENKIEEFDDASYDNSDSSNISSASRFSSSSSSPSLYSADENKSCSDRSQRKSSYKTPHISNSYVILSDRQKDHKSIEKSCVKNRLNSKDERSNASQKGARQKHKLWGKAHREIFNNNDSNFAESNDSAVSNKSSRESDRDGTISSKHGFSFDRSSALKPENGVIYSNSSSLPPTSRVSASAILSDPGNESIYSKNSQRATSQCVISEIQGVERSGVSVFNSSTELPYGVSCIPSSWGEWKAKVVQNKVQSKIGDEQNQASLSGQHSEREREAELADAEI